MKFKINNKYAKWGYLLWGFGNFYLSYTHLPPFLQEIMLSTMFFLIGLYLCGKGIVYGNKAKLEEQAKNIDTMMEAMKFDKKHTD